MKLYNLGSLNIDYVYSVPHFVAAGETLASTRMEVFPGGKGLNQSVALAKAGVPVIHGGMVGDGGEFLLQTLRDAGADISRIQKVTGSCGHAIIQVTESGENCILLHAGTNRAITEDYVQTFLQDAEVGDVLLLQNEVNNLPYIFSVAQEKGMRIAFNPSPYDESLKDLPLASVKWLFCNEVEGAAFFGDGTPEELAARFAVQYPDSTLILTLGKDGSLLKTVQKTVYQPIFQTEVVDTTAAGDTFTGYFLAAILQGKTEEVALKMASRAAAITVSRKGASCAIPTFEEL